MRMKFLLCLLLTSVISIHSAVVTFPNIENVCRTLKPVGVSKEPEAKNNMFIIQADKPLYKAGDVLKVSIKSLEPITNFLLTARLKNKEVDQGKSLGNFKTYDVSTSNICVDSYGSSITMSSAATEKDFKEVLNFEWTSLPSTKGNIIFKASVITSSGKHWVAELSDTIIDNSTVQPRSTEMPHISSINALNAEQCGKIKGCYRNPSGCDVSNCDTIVMWMDYKDHVDFQMSGDTEGFVSVAFSEDTKLGNDEVFECIWKEQAKQVEVIHMRLREEGGRQLTPTTVPFSLKDTSGWMDNRRIYCSFRFDKNVPTAKGGKFLSEKRYLLLNKGRVDKDGTKVQHNQELNKYPYVSPEMVRSSDKFDLFDNLRYPLVKAHGCLMVIAWMMSALTGLLLAKYYRPMWPNSKWCGRRVWYSAYMFCMVFCMILTVIAFIIIFIHGGGYIQLPASPDKAHAPIGIVTTILIILIPLIALCRAKDIDYDPPPYEVCANWFLWLLESVASLLATINMFIGMNLQKSHVPWWVTWIMVAFYLFHLIVELILEIHGCLNSKKLDAYYQRLRSAKASNTKPEPVGRAFKQRTLNIYLIVSICLGLVVVIGIAAG